LESIVFNQSIQRTEISRLSKPPTYSTQSPSFGRSFARRDCSIADVMKVGHDGKMVRIRAYSLVLALPLSLALISMVWFIVADSGRGMIGWLIFGAAVLLQLFLGLTIACPRCGKSPYAVGPHLGPFGVVSKPVPDTVCSTCGYDLRAADTKVG
jgi:ribosomal protein L37E